MLKEIKRIDVAIRYYSAAIKRIIRMSPSSLAAYLLKPYDFKRFNTFGVALYQKGDNEVLLWALEKGVQITPSSGTRNNALVRSALERRTPLVNRGLRGH